LSARHMVRLGLCLLLAMAASACIGESPELARAKADYVGARAGLVEAEAAQIENQTALDKESREAEMALRRERSQALVQLAQTVLPWALGLGGAALVVAVSGIVGHRLIEAERQRQEARAQALREERRLLQVWVAAARQPIPLPGAGGDGRKPAVSADMGNVDILKLLRQLQR
jgi:hypothetical protein